MVTFVPDVIFVIDVAPTIPALAVIVAPFGLVIAMLYVFPVQFDTLKLATALLHGLVLQLAGEFTVTTVVQPPTVAVAVIITLVPTGIPVMLFPDIDPADTVTVDPALLVNDTL